MMFLPRRLNIECYKFNNWLKQPCLKKMSTRFLNFFQFFGVAKIEKKNTLKHNFFENLKIFFQKKVFAFFLFFLFLVWFPLEEAIIRQNTTSSSRVTVLNSQWNDRAELTNYGSFLEGKDAVMPSPKVQPLRFQSVVVVVECNCLWFQINKLES